MTDKKIWEMDAGDWVILLAKGALSCDTNLKPDQIVERTVQLAVLFNAHSERQAAIVRRLMQQQQQQALAQQPGSGRSLQDHLEGATASLSSASQEELRRIQEHLERTATPGQSASSVIQVPPRPVAPPPRPTEIPDPVI